MIFILISNDDPSSMCSSFTLRYDIYRFTFEPYFDFLHVLFSPWDLFFTYRILNLTSLVLHYLLLLIDLNCHVQYFLIWQQSSEQFFTLPCKYIFEKELEVFFLGLNLILCKVFSRECKVHNRNLQGFLFWRTQAFDALWWFLCIVSLLGFTVHLWTMTNEPPWPNTLFGFVGNFVKMTLRT
jgi:hypothetical protein